MGDTRDGVALTTRASGWLGPAAVPCLTVRGLKPGSRSCADADMCASVPSSHDAAVAVWNAGAAQGLHGRCEAQHCEPGRCGTVCV